MTKLKLKLHQPKKWIKHDYVTKDDIDQFEYLIYNDLDIKRKIQRDIPSYNFDWVEEHLVEDEEYIQLEGELNSYCISSFGRIFSSRGKKTVKPMRVRNNFYVTLKNYTVTFRKEFFKNDWAYSPSVILDKYEKYGWLYYNANN